jgi:Prokaryotic N-terminal methylation motif
MMMNRKQTSQNLKNESGVTLIEAMIGLMIFAVGWTGVLGLMTSSFETSSRTWKSKNAYHILDRQYWELFFRVKNQDDETLDLGDIAGTYSAEDVFPGELLSNGRGVELIVVGRADLENTAASPPRVFIPAEVGGTDGMEFYPNAGGDTGGYMVRWERSEDPTKFEIGELLKHKEVLYSMSNVEGQESVSYDVTITVAWPYYEGESIEQVRRKIERTFTLSVY